MDDRTFYRQYLNPDEEPVGSSSFTKIITGTMATVGVALGLRHAYQKGALKKQMEFLIDALGSYRETKVGSYSKGLEDWLSADRVNSALEQKGLLRKGISIYGALSDLPKHIRAREIDREFRNVRMQKSPIIPDKKFELIDYIKQYESVMSRYKRGETGGGFDEKRAFLRFKELAQEEMDKAFHKLLAFNKKEQELLMKRTGYRQATVRDVWDYLGEHEKKMLQEFEKKLAGRKASYSVMDKIIDKNILVKVDADGQIQRFADLRDYKSTMHRLLKTATDDFTIPFIKINPFRMFYVHKLIRDETPIVFADLSKSRVQPFITKNGMPFLSNYSVYVNGRVFTAKATWDEERKQIGEVFLKEFEKPGLLINLKRDADKSLLARQTRNMMNLYESEHMKIEYVDSDNWFKRYIVKPISKALDLGYQNEPIGHNPEIGDPLSYASGIARWIHNKLKPYKEVRVEGSPFGDYAEWLFVPRHQTIEEIQKRGGSVKDYFAQFYAARNNPEDVTTTSFFLYTFAERLNATLNQVGLGLSAKHLGSAPQILSNLTTKRIFPVLLTVEGFKYSNYLYEQYAGDEYEDQLANMFVNTQFFMADVFENLGLTEKFKDAKDLFVGYNFITELPVPVLTTEGLTPIQLGDLLPLDKTREELEEYYETGKEPVRKGRYWETGNTPFIGSKIEYWRPNWYQRITSDWQYTDTLWGSKEEYWDNHFLISPLNHFLLDPYHWEKKWYYDRPYPMTGGIAEIEAIPLIGPLLDRTVGQLLKPTQIMHSDEWLNPDKGNEKIGFQIAKALGIIEEKIGGAMVNGGIVQSVDGLIGGTAYHGVDIMSHVSSGVGTYDEYDVEHSPIAYVTASGNIRPLRMTELYDNTSIQSDLSKGVSINRVGLTEDVSVEEGTIAYEEEIVNPASVHSALTDFYYNTSEMAGFYGWVSSLGLKNPMDQYNPEWMTSSKAYGYERAFWDKGYGNLGADAMEIFRRFVPRDEHKNYINPIDNRMPSWLPDGDYFINFQQGDPFCLSKDTLVDVETGFKRAEEVVVGDMILTHKGRRLPVVGIIKRPILNGEKSYRFNIAGLDSKIPLEFSEEHPILIKRLQKCSFGSSCICRPDVRNFNGFCDSENYTNKWDLVPIEFVEAKDVQVGDAVVYPIPVIENPVQELAYAYEWRDASRSPSYIVHGTIPLTKDFAWLLGMYLAEGSTAKQNGKPIRLLFSLSSSEEDVAKRISSILREIFGKEPTIQRRRNSTEIVLCDAKAARIMSYLIPGTLYEKRVPLEIFKASREVRLSLLFGFLLGDGSVHRNYLIGTSANRDLILDLYKLAFTCGLPAQYVECNTGDSYELLIHTFHLLNEDLSDLMYKADKVNRVFTRQPSVLSWTDGKYIYSIVTSKQEIILDYVYGFEVNEDDTFCVIGFATHNTKIKQGEMRLPGEAYEKLYGIDRDKLMEMSIGSSFIGYDIPEIINHLLKRDKVKSDAFQEILDKGSELHKEYEKYFDELGIAIKVEKDVEDPTHHVKGTYDMMVDTKKIIEWAKANNVEMYYYGAAIGDGSEEYEGYYYSPVVVDDQMAQELIERSPELTADIKTRGQNQFDKKQLKFENVQKVNFYARHTGTQVNAIVEYNRDDPTAKPRIYMFDYNPYLYDYSMKKVETARGMVRQMIEDGAIGVGDLYSIVDRYRILADVAPYSEEFRNLKKQLSMMDLEEEEKEEIRKINEYVQQQKDPLPTYDYRFKTANVRDVSVTVTKIVDNNTFYTEEFGDHPIRLAGVFVPSGKDEAGQQATEFVRKYLKEGMRIQIAIDADAGERDLFNQDTYESISAVVRVGNIRNLNRELIERGLAKEKENDYSPAGVHARFSPEEIVIGKAWETFAHLDTPIHTKLLQVRSPLEQYERRDIYGKNFQSWNEPFDDYFIPWYQNWISKAPLAAITLGTAIGSLFGNTRKGKVIGAAIGFLGTSLGVGYRTIFESLSGKAWIPERREKEREIETYMDALKFVKYRKLYEETARIALEEEGFDVKAYIEREMESGDSRQARLRKLMNIKQRLAAGDRRAIAEARKYVGWHWSMDGYIKAINEEINEIKNTRKAEYIPEIAAQAIAYYQESETTMYAYDPGDPLDKVLKALPHKERIYVKKFMDAPHEERQRILEITPWYVRRILQSYWGLPVDEKPDLIQLFSKYQLPDDQWLGWDPRANLEDIKLKIVKKEGLELSEFNLWAEDEKRARFVDNDHVPQWRQGLNANEVKERLRRILGEAGVESIVIEVQESKKPGVQVDMDIEVDRRREVINLMNQNRDSLI